LLIAGIVITRVDRLEKALLSAGKGGES
jgi:hypothetical protein